MNSARHVRPLVLATASLVAFTAVAYSALPKGSLRRFLYFNLGLKARHDDAALTFDEFIERQAAISWDLLLKNIHPAGTSPGCVVASPSRRKPDYWYQWTRDSSLVLRAVLRKYKDGDQSLLSIMLDFVEATQDMQHRETPCGGFRTGGLGEVKFEINREPFTGNWGRPQRDGPALRAALLISFARHYLKVGGSDAESFVVKTLYDLKDPTDSVIKADLEYVAEYWSQKGFDLWEEVNGSHFYTLLVSLRAMKDGAAFARERNDPTAAARYAKVASDIALELKQFWDPKKGYIQVTKDAVYIHGKVSGLDTCVVLGVLHAGEEVGEWDVTDERVMATHFAIVESMRHEYPITKMYEYKYGTGVGRYREDVYDGVGMSLAHPWYLCTLAHAEYLYRLADALASKSLDVSSLNRPFLQAISQTALPPVLSANSVESKSMIQALRARGDEFVQVVRDWKGSKGNLAEQFSRFDGSPQGAKDLTWSYAAFLSMQAARRGEYII